MNTVDDYCRKGEFISQEHKVIEVCISLLN